MSSLAPRHQFIAKELDVDEEEFELAALCLIPLPVLDKVGDPPLGLLTGVVVDALHDFKVMFGVCHFGLPVFDGGTPPTLLAENRNSAAANPRFPSLAEGESEVAEAVMPRNA
jgi:hypothetical protein